MARLRTIKPEFWTSEQITNCSPLARLLFIGMWNFADDNGVLPASSKRLKMEVFPSDEISTSDITKWIEELVVNDLIRKFKEGDQEYLFVTGWKKHQIVRKPYFRFPAPPSGSVPYQYRTGTVPVQEQCCTSTVGIKNNKKEKEKEKRESKVDTGGAETRLGVFEHGAYKTVDVMSEFVEYIEPLSKFFVITPTDRWVIEMFYAWHGRNVIREDVEAVILENEERIRDGIIKTPQSLKSYAMNFAAFRMRGDPYPRKLSDKQKMDAYLRKVEKETAELIAREDAENALT